MPSRGTTSSRWSRVPLHLRRRGGDLSRHRPLTHNCCALTHPLLIPCSSPALETLSRAAAAAGSGPAVPAVAMLRRPASARLTRSTAPCHGN